MPSVCLTSVEAATLGSLKMVKRSPIPVVSYITKHALQQAKLQNFILSDCPVKGQVFNECGSACPPNCTTPNPICTRQCVPRCECPRGTVINELTNTCVRTNKCPLPGTGKRAPSIHVIIVYLILFKGSCPPKCSAAYCKRNPSSICSV